MGVCHHRRRAIPTQYIETHNGVVFTQQACVAEGEQESPLTVLSRTTLAEILKFANEVPFAAIRLFSILRS